MECEAPIASLFSPVAELTEISYDETGGHLLRTQRYVRALAHRLAEQGAFPDVLTSENLPRIACSALLHDIGKAAIPSSILMKPGPLTREEFETVKTHTTLGKNAILREELQRNIADDPFLRFAKEIAYSHHERWDGTGYPLRLRGEAIPVSARLMALADVYDALTSKRVYKDAYTHEQAVRMVQSSSGTHFDPRVVETFMELETVFREIGSCYDCC